MKAIREYYTGCSPNQIFIVDDDSRVPAQRTRDVYSSLVRLFGGSVRGQLAIALMRSCARLDRVTRRLYVHTCVRRGVLIQSSVELTCIRRRSAVWEEM
jgi:hypothetical protein